MSALEEVKAIAKILDETEERIANMETADILKVLTDWMFWHHEGPGFSCHEAEALAAAAVIVGATLEEMASLVVRCHGQPGRSEDEGDDHYHEEET